MAKSLFTDAHKVVVAVLLETRQRSGLFQADVAAKLGRDQSYISNIERGQRRVDLVEFFELAEALNADPVLMFSEIAKRIE